MLLQRAADVITDTVLKVRLCCSSCQGVDVGRCWKSTGTTVTVAGSVPSPVFSAEGIFAPANRK